MGGEDITTQIAKGVEAEEYMNLWLQQNGIGFFAINQSTDSLMVSPYYCQNLLAPRVGLE